MPALPSPPITARTQSPQKPAIRSSTISRRPGSAASVRRPLSAASTRNGTPKVPQNGVPNTGSAASVRRPPSATSSRTGTPKVQQNGVPSRLQSTKARETSDKENGTKSTVGKAESKPATKAESRTARRQTSAGILAREKGPSKDGTTQRAAKEVEGLRNFVSVIRSYARPSTSRGYGISLQCEGRGDVWHLRHG